MGVVVKTRGVTPPGDKMNNNYYHTEAVEIRETKSKEMKANGNVFGGVRNKHHLQRNMEETFVHANTGGGDFSRGVRGGEGDKRDNYKVGEERALQTKDC